MKNKSFDGFTGVNQREVRLVELPRAMAEFDGLLSLHSALAYASAGNVLSPTIYALQSRRYFERIWIWISATITWCFIHTFGKRRTVKIRRLLS